MSVAALPRARAHAGSVPGWAAALGCLAVSAVTLAVPATLGFDPWAWLVWGREVGRWSLDTTGGPSWKPLPVAATTLVAPFGELAVPAYAVLARTAALLAVVAVFRLARHLGGPMAGAVAALALVVTPDGDPRFVRLVLEGHEAPWSAGLAAAALLALLERRRGWALAWTWALAMLRPEAWPFLLALVAWRRGTWGWPTPRGWLTLASIPILWFVPDWIGSGSPLHGAGHAQVLADEPAAARLLDSLATAAGMVPLPVWVLAAVAVASGARRHDPVPAALALAALAWTTLVIAMGAVAGYAAISRFFLPAAAVTCVLTGAGLVEAGAWMGARRGAAAVASVLAVALVAPRVLGVVDVVEEVAERGRLEDELDATIDAAGGPDVLARCGAAVVTARTLLRSAVAWKLDLPMRAVEPSMPERPAVLLLESARAVALSRADPRAVELASRGRWTAFGDRCLDASG